MSQKIIIFIVLLVIVLGLALFGYFKAIPAPQGQEQLPKIEITPKSFDFGQIEYGKVVEHTFQVKNLGEEILEIKKLATSCACTTAEISKEKIIPREEADLKVTYDTGLMTGPHAKGEQERIIYVKSSDPLNPQAEVMIYANVK